MGSATTFGIDALFGIVCVVVARGGIPVLEVGAIGIAIASAIALEIGSTTRLVPELLTLGILAVVFCEESRTGCESFRGAIKSAADGDCGGTLT